MTFEELKQEFIDNGFQVEGDSFVHEFEDPHTSINGIHPKKRFEMTYTGEGSMCTEGDSDEEILYQFDILGPGRAIAYSICIRDFNDFQSLT